MKAIRIITTLLLLFFTHLPIEHSGKQPDSIENYLSKFHWVDSLMKTMTLEEKIGQLFMVRAHTNKGPEHEDFVEHQVKNLKVGGICLFQGTKSGHKALVERLNKRTRIPLFVSIDGEWGLNMRLKSFKAFPKAMSIGASTRNDLVFRMGQMIAEECKSIGVNMNFGPVLDVNNNPNNPVINYRSFGESPSRVAELGHQYASGMISKGVIPCGKHFPGHGDTGKDSHYDLPVINKDFKSLDSIELMPFRRTIRHGLPAIMTAHLHVPKVDSTKNLPSSLSKIIIKDILRDSLQFRGLVITDALEMQGVRKHFSDESIALKAFKAGNDILLLPHDITRALSAIKNAIASKDILMEELDQKVSKILAYKYDYARIQPKLVQLDSIAKDQLISDIASSSICLVKNEGNIIPLHNRYTNHHLISFGDVTEETTFSKEISKRMSFGSKSILSSINTAQQAAILDNISKNDLIILALHFDKQRPSKRYSISLKLEQFIAQLNNKGELLINYFGNPYGLKYLDQFPNIILSNETLDAYQLASAQSIYGTGAYRGVLPVSVNAQLKAGKGYLLQEQKSLKYSTPESLGMSTEVLDSIAIIAKEGIRQGAFPSAVVLVAKQGKIVYHESFGHQTYSQIKAIRQNTVYDVASITKVMTTLSIMKLVDQGKIDINSRLGEFLPLVRASNKDSILIKDILQHIAGLKPWIPFYENTIEKTTKGRVRLSADYYATEASDEFPTPVDGKHFLIKNYQDSIYQAILDSEVFEEKKYRYSDIGFYLLNKLVEEQSKMTLDQFLSKEFFSKMNLQNSLFNPSTSIDVSEIPPTEYDQYFRGKEIRAYVHDMGAAMLGGVSGHAGLFSNAYDLATIFQMLLDSGKSFDHEILKKESIDLFTQRYDDTRRGLGFDMKELNRYRKKSTCKLASERCFGHYGFTGTAAWADPKEELVYVFLSNRTYPSMTNFKINKLDIRRKIQEVIYRSIQSSQDSVKAIEQG